MLEPRTMSRVTATLGPGALPRPAAASCRRPPAGVGTACVSVLRAEHNRHRWVESGRGTGCSPSGRASPADGGLRRRLLAALVTATTHSRDGLPTLGPTSVDCPRVSARAPSCTTASERATVTCRSARTTMPVGRACIVAPVLRHGAYGRLRLVHGCADRVREMRRGSSCNGGGWVATTAGDVGAMPTSAAACVPFHAGRNSGWIS